MKLTKIEVYEIQAFAFRVMTGYMAPGKDASPLADETPYEGRCAAWDEWRNEHAPCILAMLHGFEALIDRDDGTIAECEALLLAAGVMPEENESLRATISRLREYARHDPSCKSWGRIPHPCNCGYDALMADLVEGK